MPESNQAVLILVDRTDALTTIPLATVIVHAVLANKIASRTANVIVALGVPELDSVASNVVVPQLLVVGVARELRE
jgi:hypothetical protein